MWCHQAASLAPTSSRCVACWRLTCHFFPFVCHSQRARCCVVAVVVQSRLTDAGAMFIHGGCAQGILDLRGNLLDCNRVNTLLFGASKEELMTRGIFSSVPAEQLPQAYQGWAAMLSTPPSVSQLPKARWAVQTSKYGTLAVDVVTTIVRDPEGKPQYLLCSVMPAGSDGDEPEDEACVRDSQRRRLTLPEEELASDAGVGVGGGVGDVMLPPSTSQTQRAEVVPDGDGDAANLDLLAGFDVCGDTAFAPLPPVVPLSPLTPLVDEIANGCQQPPRRNGVSYAAASVTTAASVVPASSVALESFDSLCRLSGDFPSCAALALASPSQSSVAADAMPDDELWHSLGCVDDLMPAGIQ